MRDVNKDISMTTIRKLILCVVFVFVLSIILSSKVKASTIVDSGYCGDPEVNGGKNVTWTLDNEGTLTISGEGAMGDYYGDDVTPVPGYYSSQSEGCDDNIKKCIISKGVTSIGKGSFALCYKLESISIPSTVISIGELAFLQCDLKYISIPESVKYIGVGALGCQELRAISVDPNNNYYCSDGGALFNKAKTTIIRYPAHKDYEITNLTDLSYTIPDSVTRIGVGAFAGCRLNSVIIPDTVEVIDDEAFSGCTISRIVIPKSVTSIGEEAFSCSSLSEVSISDSVLNIGKKAFYWCLIETIDIPRSVTSIGEGAFSCCRYLKNVNVNQENSVYSSIDGVLFDKNITEILFYPEGRTEKEYSIPFGVKNINKCIFLESRLESIVIPSSVANIGEWAFYQCDNLSNVIIPESVENIEESAFGQCDNLSTVTIMGSSTNVGYAAFGSCNKLSNIKILGNGIKFKGGPTSDCNSLITVNITPSFMDSEELSKIEGLVSIEVSPNLNKEYYYASEATVFYNYSIDGVLFRSYLDTTPYSAETTATELLVLYPENKRSEEYDVPDKTTSIGWNSFRKCKKLATISLPKSIRGMYAEFEGCDSLTDIYYDGTEDEWKKVCFSSPNGITIHFKKSGYTSDNSTYRPTYTYIPSTQSGTFLHETENNFLEFDSGIKGSIYKQSGNNPRIDTGWSFDLLKKPSNEYQRKLAVTGLVLAGNAYNGSLLQQTLNKMGFSKISSFNPDNYLDHNQVGHTFASTRTGINGKSTNVIAVVVRGSANGPDWVSNITAQAAGFREAAERVKKDLEIYISEKRIDTSIPTKLIITGHSRGAAVSNILGTICGSIATRDNTYVYTYACPKVTTDFNMHDYKNIYNFSNSLDNVPGLPLMIGWDNRYGTSRNYGFNELSSNGFQNALYEIAGVSNTHEAYNVRVDSSYKTFNMIGHAPAVYMACLLSDKNGNGFDTEIGSDYRNKVISVKCPVDVEVYDGNNKLLGTVIDNVPSEDLLTNCIYVRINGDEKYLYMPSGMDIYLKLVGSDKGEMTYSVEEVNSSGETVNCKVFSNVSLTDGKTMSSTIANDINAEDIELYVTNSGTITKEISENGSESDVAMISFVTGAPEQIRDVSVTKGGKVSELPEPKLEGYDFAGWYTDKELTTPFNPDTKINESMTLYASYYEAYGVYGTFGEIKYNGSSLTSKLNYEYNHMDSNILVALYQDGRMIKVQYVHLDSGEENTQISMPVSNLYGIYYLKAFIVDDNGNYTPISTSAEARFFAD